MPKAPIEIRSLARGHTETALKVLAGIMSNENTNASARVAAATALLDRGWGKPKQELDIDGRLEVTAVEWRVVGKPEAVD